MTTLLSKGNAFRKSIKEKKIVLNDLERGVENLKKEKRKLICKSLKIDELGCITAISDKNYGKNCYLDNFVLLPFLRS